MTYKRGLLALEGLVDAERRRIRICVDENKRCDVLREDRGRWWGPRELCDLQGKLSVKAQNELQKGTKRGRWKERRSSGWKWRSKYIGGTRVKQGERTEGENEGERSGRRKIKVAKNEDHSHLLHTCDACLFTNVVAGSPRSGSDTTRKQTSPQSSAFWRRCYP
jgi:hypothetical protein